MTTVNGLPAHVLLVHAVVVLIPLAALLLVVAAVWPPGRARLAVPAAVVSVIALITVPLTTDAGEWLEHRLPSSALLREHTELGDSMLPWAIGLAVVALVLAGRELLARRGARATIAAGGPGEATTSGARHSSPTSVPGGVAVTAVLAILAVVVSVGAVYTVYEIGDSGARAAWTGKFSPTPLPRAGQPAPPDGG
jgi:hypothetical protein